jgi:adenosylcobinamide-GDP ribazoletransferase
MNKGIRDRFLSALGFVTVLPTGGNYTFTASGMTAFFPLVGLIVGGLLAGCDTVARALWNPGTTALVDVIFLILMTGAFHLDGLADTADGLFSHRSRERMLEIMKDSRIGAMGVVALICVLALKWAGIGSLPEEGAERVLVLVLVPSYARASLLFGIRFLPYGRSEGTGKGHFDKPLPAGDFLWLVIPVLLSLGLGWKTLILHGTFILMVTAFLGYYKRKTGCITGDMLGAMVEVGEAILFMALATGQ